MCLSVCPVIVLPWMERILPIEWHASVTRDVLSRGRSHCALEESERELGSRLSLQILAQSSRRSACNARKRHVSCSIDERVLYLLSFCLKSATGFRTQNLYKSTLGARTHTQAYSYRNNDRRRGENEKEQQKQWRCAFSGSKRDNNNMVFECVR